MKLCPLYVPQLKVLVMLFELLAAPPSPVSVNTILCKLFTGGIIIVFDVKYLQAFKLKL